MRTRALTSVTERNSLSNLLQRVISNMVAAMPASSASGSSGALPAMTDCPPITARILQGNPATIGKIGGFPGQPVTAGGAAVIPDQWGGKARLRPNLGDISGQFQGAGGQAVTFDGVSDVIGGKSPVPGMNVRDALQQRYPGDLIIELPGAPKDYGTMTGSVRVPAGMICPVPAGKR